LQTTHTRLKTLIKITLFSPFVVKTLKREKIYEAKMRCQLLIVLRLLIVDGLLLIIIIIRNMSRANTEGSQLGRSQRGVGVGDRWKDRNIGKLQEQLIPLSMNDLLVAPHNLQALLHDIQAMIHVLTHHKDASEHL
jgi:hypothetical protein